MIVQNPITRYSPDDLLAMPDANGYELVDGQLVERNVGALSTMVELFVCERLLSYARASKAGMVWSGAMGFQIFPFDPGRIRKPDASFISKEKLSSEVMESGFIKVVPDLVVEVLSPNDLVYEVDRKIVEYKRAGVRLIWIINPETRSVTVYRPDGTASYLNDTDKITGEDVLPGFESPVSDFFPDAVAMKEINLA